MSEKQPAQEKKKRNLLTYVFLGALALFGLEAALDHK